jgi:serine phosphatase RsbU (regulator of sigma subunit)
MTRWAVTLPRPLLKVAAGPAARAGLRVGDLGRGPAADHHLSVVGRNRSRTAGNDGQARDQSARRFTRYLAPGRLGLVLADISGKGIFAALLMASLQASLRSHYAQAPDDLPRVLRAVNQTFFESTATSRSATLFFGIYDETTSRLRYANCGHPPPVLLAPDGSIERLAPMGPVIGLFEEWACTTRHVDLGRDYTLVMFTDGVVEAFDAKGEEFGERRLVDLMRERAGQSAARLVDALVEAVQRHSGPAQSDDFTVVVARGRELRH